MLTWSVDESQESEDDMLETYAKRVAEHEYSLWQERKRKELTTKGSWVGGATVAGASAKEWKRWGITQ